MSNKNQDPQEDFGPDPVLLHNALGRTLNDLVELAEVHERAAKKGASHETPPEGQATEFSEPESDMADMPPYEEISPDAPRIEVIEHEAAALQREYDRNPSPELNERIKTLRAEYDELLLKNAEKL